jgi:hypothetical protein
MIFGLCGEKREDSEVEMIGFLKQLEAGRSAAETPRQEDRLDIGCRMNLLMQPWQNCASATNVSFEVQIKLHPANRYCWNVQERIS